MKIPFAFSTAFLTLTAVLQAQGAVLCEFQPNLAMDDCEYCFKQDEYGLRLYLAGKLRASSTDPSRFPRTPIDGISYQRGVEKEKVSARNGKARLFEICREGSTPLVAGAMTLTMSEADLQEFDLGNPGRGVGKDYQFAISGDVSSGSASFFENRLVFMAPSHWSGRSTIPFVVIDDEGKASVPGVITVISPSKALPVPAPQAAVESEPTAEDLEIAAQQQLNEELRSELASTLILLDEAKGIGSEVQAQIADLEAMVQQSYRRVTALDAHIAELRKANNQRRRERALYSIDPAQVGFEQMGPARVVASLRNAAVDEEPMLPNTPEPAPERPLFVLPSYASVRVTRGGPSVSMDLSPPEPCNGAQAQPERQLRRLTKREKKRAKRERRAA